MDVVYQDLQKAFDKVPHKRLLTKLKGYGIHDEPPDCIEDFLTDMTHYVNVGSECSEDVAVMDGVHQGSVLGTTLFTLVLICLKLWIASRFLLMTERCKY